VKHASTVGLKKPSSVSIAAGVGRGMRESWGSVSSREVVDMLGGGGSERNEKAYKASGEDDSPHRNSQERANFDGMVGWEDRLD
jgi:hypothetical protein